jgi:DNA polymerase II large subunit
MNMEKEIEEYYKTMEKKINEHYNIAENAKQKKHDPETHVECKKTTDLADRTEKIIGPHGIATRFRELSKKQNDRNKVIFEIFKEIIEQKWVKIPDPEKRLEQAVKTCLVLVTEGVVVAPLDGVPSVKINKNFDGTPYIDIYFAGPIRAAGGTATVYPLILGDYARQLMQLDKYKPTEEEIERYVEECNIYDEIITRQYKLTDEEVRKIIRGCPVCINGEPTEQQEVTANKNLERIKTNRIRGGMCLVISEGVGLKAQKILSLTKILGLDWNWIEDIIKVSKTSTETEELKPNYNYLKKLAAGRPILAYPSYKGGFRLRYGKGRNTGIMARAIHPATMELLDNFIAVGTQIKVERPGKSAEIFPCDTIEGPTVLLKNKEVKKIKTMKEAQETKNQVKEILYLGDMLITLGDFRKSAHPLLPAGYCEEWWEQELKEKKITPPKKIDAHTAINLSMEHNIPLHPEYLHYYNCITRNELEKLVQESRKSEKEFQNEKITACHMQETPETKNILEKIGIPHTVKNKKITIEKEHAHPFLKTTGALNTKPLPKKEKNTQTLTELSGIIIKDKAGTFIGARMGRPEQAKPRKMIGNPHVLFPIGLAGGPTRSINKAANYEQTTKKTTETELPTLQCPKCKKIDSHNYCEKCQEKTTLIRICPKGHYATKEQTECPACKEKTLPYTKRPIEANKKLNTAKEKLKTKIPDTVKGVKGLINEEKIHEPLEKGILRAKHDLHIFRDATIRYELLNAPLTHFKPKEINMNIQKAKELGYTKDMHGKELQNENQTLTLYPQDIIVNEDAGEHILKTTKFIDELLEKYYQQKKIYNKNTKEEIIGEIILALAPHTSAAVAGRIIGYTQSRVCFAHPYFHLCKRRNCDGDQDSIMLLTDALINFSTHYLPSTRGGRMDAPLVFTTKINPLEIDDEAHEIETETSYPKEFYELTQKRIPSNIDNIPKVKNHLGQPNQYTCIKYTHDTQTFDEGPKKSAYITFQTMKEKMEAQAKLQSKIRAVEKKDALERVLVSHFLPDIIGNARAFSRQTFRCTKCNEKYRRIPLTGKCTKCKEGNLILTVAQGSVKKYLETAKKLVEEYQLQPYLKQRIDLIEQEINSVFTQDQKEQKNLTEWTQPKKQTLTEFM